MSGLESLPSLGCLPSCYFPINSTAWRMKGAGREAHFSPFGFLFDYLKDRMAAAESDFIEDGVTGLQALMGSQAQGGSWAYATPVGDGRASLLLSCYSPQLPSLLPFLTYCSQDN